MYSFGRDSILCVNLVARLTGIIPPRSNHLPIGNIRLDGCVKKVERKHDNVPLDVGPVSCLLFLVSRSLHHVPIVLILVPYTVCPVMRLASSAAKSGLMFLTQICLISNDTERPFLNFNL